MKLINFKNNKIKFYNNQFKMGNETTCQKCNIKEEEEENEITAKEKPYDFKRIVYKIFNFQKIA